VAFSQSDPDETAGVIAKQKEASAEWKLYLSLRAAQGK
jgi:hypothetical protein